MDQTVVQIEEEERMEKMMIEDYANDKLKNEDEDNKKGTTVELEATTVVKKKFENLKYGEEIMAAIDLAEEMRETYM